MRPIALAIMPRIVWNIGHKFIYSLCTPLFMPDRLEDLLTDPEAREALQKIVPHEEDLTKRYETDPVYKALGDVDKTPYWEWSDIPVDWPIVKRLLLAGAVEAMGGKRKWYVLKDREAVKKALQEYELAQKAREVTPHVLEKPPEDLFSTVVGYDDVKKLFTMSLGAEKQTHILLIGPPASAKSVILLEVGRLPGAYYLLGGTTKAAGLIEALFTLKPLTVLLDECDKMSSDDFTALLSMMETGIVKEVKYGKTREMVLPARVYAACNRIDRIPPELLSRFQFKLTFPPYKREDFIEVATRVLTTREGKPYELARYIALKVADLTSDVRDCVGIGRIAKDRNDVDFLIAIKKKYATL